MSGHLILNPAGEEIRVPNHAINTLKLLKVTVFNRKRRLRQITEAIFPLLKREYDTITSGKESYKGNGLRLVLGPDCSGPDWCQCECKKCSKLEEDTDTTALKRTRDGLPRDVQEKPKSGLFRRLLTEYPEHCVAG